MPNEEKNCCQDKKWNAGNAGTSGAVYGMGFIGALIFYIQTATTFWIGVLGFFKAIFWPAILIYKLLQFLG